MGLVKERAPAVSLSLWVCPLRPLPQNTTTAPTLDKLATSNRKGQVPSPPNNNPLSIYINGWFVTATRMFQRAEGCAVLLLFNTAIIGRGVVAGKESPPSCSPRCDSAIFTPSPKTLPLPPLTLPLPTARKGRILPPPYTSEEEESNDNPLSI